MKKDEKENDFSLKWFGIPDKVVVKFWAKLEKLPLKPKRHLRLIRGNKP